MLTVAEEQLRYALNLPVHNRCPPSPPGTQPTNTYRHSTSSYESTQLVDVGDSLQRIQNIKQRFNENKHAFSFPRFVDVGVDSSWTNCKTVDTTALYSTVLIASARNDREQSETKQEHYTIYFGSEGGHRIHQYLHSLDQLLLDLAKISAGGDEAVKVRGGVVMGEVVNEINIVEQWKTTVCEMASMVEI